MNFANVGGITLHYRQEGLQTGIPLVFINSLGTDLRLWDELVKSLANRYAIVRYDKRGHGLSDCPPGPYSIRDETNDLAGLLAHLEIEEAIVVGISVGGMIALDYAGRHPERTKSLVLSDTAPRIGTADTWNGRIAALRDKGMAPLSDTIVARWFAPEFAIQRPTDYRGFTNMFVRTPLEGYTATCEAIRDADLTEIVGTIKAKALVLCGEKDVATPPNSVRDLATILENAHFELVEEAAHLPCAEQPASMAEKITRFFAENGYV